MFTFQQIVYVLGNNVDSVFTVLACDCCSGMYLGSTSEQLNFKQTNYFRLLYVFLCFRVYSINSQLWAPVQQPPLTVPIPFTSSSPDNKIKYLSSLS
jgi:hypothetical protein